MSHLTNSIETRTPLITIHRSTLCRLVTVCDDSKFFEEKHHMTGDIVGETEWFDGYLIERDYSKAIICLSRNESK